VEAVAFYALGQSEQRLPFFFLNFPQHSFFSFFFAMPYSFFF